MSHPIKNSKLLAYLPVDFEGEYFIDENITTITGGAFYYCKNLIDVAIPSTVTTIDSIPFFGCGNLQYVYSFASTPAKIKGGLGKNNVTRLLVPAGCKPAYEAVQAWKTPFNEIVELYELTVESANPERGTASVTKRIITTPGSQIVDAEIKATPKDGYKFVKWSDGNTDNPRTVTVDRDVTFTAQFAEETVAVDDVISAIAVWGDRQNALHRN